MDLFPEPNAPASESVATRDFFITCADGVQLAATIYDPGNCLGAILIGPATGIKRVFYRAFAQYLAENGFGVLIFDNRGIGDSLNGPIKKSTASLVEWGQLDMPAALDALMGHFPHAKYHLIGHSAGGQLIGFMPNALALTSIFNVAASSGSLKNMTYPFKAKAHFFMNIFIPLNNLLWGFTPAQWVGMGEPLPKNVAQQWRHWCNGSGYAQVFLRKNPVAHCYDTLHCPALWIHATDDTIATQANVMEMIRVFPQLNAKLHTLIPREHGLREIGHMKFFSRQNKVLWPIALEWLQQF